MSDYQHTFEYRVNDLPYGKFTVQRKIIRTFKPDFIDRLIGLKPEVEEYWAYLDRWGRQGWFSEEPIEFDSYPEACLFGDFIKGKHQEQ